jgi:hypothetical protein
MSTHGTLTAKEAADLLKIRVQTLYTHKGVLKARKDADGHIVFDERIVRDVAEGRLDLGIGKNGRPQRSQLESKTIMIIFNTFKQEGVSGSVQAEIVCRTGIAPEVVQRYARDWQRMHGSIVLDADHLQRIYTHASYLGVSPCATAEDFLGGLLDSLGGEHLERCVTCQTRPRLLCKFCRERLPPAKL